MPHRGPFALAAVLALALCPFLCGSASARDEDPSLPFPLLIEGNESTGFLMRPVSEALETLDRLDRVRLSELLLPTGELVDLSLTRIPLALPEGGITVNGKIDPSSLADLDLSLWKGGVVGLDSSEVFLAFSGSGSHGWIKTPGEVFHLIATPGDGGDWSRSVSILTTESRLRELEVVPGFECSTDRIPQPRLADAMERLEEEGHGAPRLGTGSPLPLYRCRLAVETDTQFFDLFGNFNAARNYALALLGALSDRYREQMGTLLTIKRLGMYPFAEDPWTTQESGGGSGDLLNEFREAWDNGAAPVAADLYHFVSGASLGGGVAYVNVLCNQNFGFAVSGNLHGQTPIPIIPGHNLNWDFFVIAHELGHNFGTLHTHDYSPPIDECASGICITDGTIMSYCHGCPGGMTNITTYFHPRVVGVVRPLVESSCLPLYRGIFPTDVGHALSGSNGTPLLEVSFSPDPDTLTFEIRNAPVARTGYFIASTQASYRPFRGEPAGTLVPRLDGLVRPIPTGLLGEITLDKDVSAFSFPGGQLLWAQMWIRDPAGPNGWAATNGVELELIRP